MLINQSLSICLYKLIIISNKATATYQNLKTMCFVQLNNWNPQHDTEIQFECNLVYSGKTFRN